MSLTLGGASGSSVPFLTFEILPLDVVKVRAIFACFSNQPTFGFLGTSFNPTSDATVLAYSGQFLMTFSITTSGLPGATAAMNFFSWLSILLLKLGAYSR